MRPASSNCPPQRVLLRALGEEEEGGESRQGQRDERDENDAGVAGLVVLPHRRPVLFFFFF